ncbi:hypothetical protein AAGV28_03955 [Flavobacterium sp. FZUC8N2.13]|uniref:Four helix bundle protein n=1 Tax=Flavobacterium zubiriense TaxID=3138075 RepID=A0ABV4T926_9FLAO
MTSRYIYFISKSSTVIYKLCIGKGTAKERLRECELEIVSMLLAPVPENLLPLKKRIEKNLFYSGFRSSTEKNMASLAKSLYGKRNSTASKFIKDIYDLHAQVESFINYPEQ